MGRLLAIWGGWSVQRRAVAAAAAAIAVAAIGVGGYLLLKRPGDVSNPGAAFEAERPNRPKKAKTVAWPIYGYDVARTKSLDVKGIRPPYRRLWKWDSGELMEFSPVYAKGRIYGTNNDALVFALDADSGKVAWKKQLGRLSASSPAFHKGVLYVVTLDPGQALALRARDGKLMWRRALPGRVESSPVVYKGKVIFGCECNSVFGLDAKSGKVIWQAPTDGAVKAAPAIADNKVYVGDYAGQMYAFSAVNGSEIWASGDQGGSFGRSGRFYSTPAVAFGRVYAGNVDGRVYSFATSNGELAWSQSTGNWVYSGIVVSRVGKRPAVFTGSFDKNAYAFDARSGEVLWSSGVGGIVSGSGTIVGDIFYLATLNGETVGLDADTGKRVFRFNTGEYNPVISDGRRIYLTGYSSVSALEPKRVRRRGGGAKRAGGNGSRAKRAGGNGSRAKGAGGDRSRPAKRAGGRERGR